MFCMVKLLANYITDKTECLTAGFVLCPKPKPEVGKIRPAGRMRPAGSYKKMNRSTEDAKTFSFAPHLYFRRTQDIQWKTGYARI